MLFRSEGSINEPSLQTVFAVKNGSLFIETYGHFDPLQERLVFLSSGDKTKSIIKSLNDLKNRVTISTPSAALNYVRLLTSPRTFRCFQMNRVEVVAKKWVTADYLFGDQSYFEWQKKHNDRGMDGLLNSAKCKKLGVEQPVVKKTPQGYEIQRTFLKGFDEQTMGYQVKEFVGFNGEYKLVSEKRLPQYPWREYVHIVRLR